jgi:hypothetical protein
VLARSRAAIGNTLYLSEAPDGVRLIADPGFEAKMEAAGCWRVCSSN